MDAGGELWRDHFAVTPSRFHSRSADLTVSGSLYEFDNPVVDWRLASTFATTETMREFGIKDLQGGAITVNGIGHHDPQTPLFFDGRIAANHLSVAAPSASQSGLRLHEASLMSRLVLDSATLKLSDLLISSPEGNFAGTANLASYRDFQLSGVYPASIFSRLLRSSFKSRFPWSATISGPVSLTARLEPTLQNVESRGELAFQPRAEGIPLSGKVRYHYQQRNGEFVIEESHLTLPNSQLTVSGQPNADVMFALDSTNLADLNPGLSLVGVRVTGGEVPSLERGGSAHLRGVAHLGTANLTEIDGTLEVSKVQWRGASADRLRADFYASPSQLRIASLVLESPLLQSTASFQVALTAWKPNRLLRFKLPDLSLAHECNLSFNWQTRRLPDKSQVASPSVISTFAKPKLLQRAMCR